MSNKPFQYGGQAVIEGVMMRGPKHIAVAVRNSQGNIVIEHEQVSPWLNRFFLAKWPILRGLGALAEALVLGIKALSFSASQAGEEEEEQLSGWQIALTMTLAMALGAFLFIVAPTSLVHLVREYIPGMFWQNLVEGIIRILIFFGYVLLISYSKEIQRVFQYHGAEHKVIHTYEAKEELTVENARKHTTLHPRCGTSFLLFVMVIKILVFSLLPDAILVWKVAMRLALVPLVAGLAYEVIKISGRYPGFWPVRIFIAPGLWLQRLTTREPEDDQLEVAIASLQKVLALEEQEQGSLAQNPVTASATVS